MNPLIVTQADHALLTLPPDVVTMNSKVVYSNETAGVQRAVMIVYPREADAAAGRISVLSPIGTALLGLSVGQSIEWDFPGGSRRTLRVDELVHQPERKLQRLKPIELTEWR